MIRRGLTYSPTNIVDGADGVRVLRSSNINEDHFVLNDDDVFVDEGAVNIDLVHDGDILITAANGSPRLVGKRARISDLPGKTVHGGFMLVASSPCSDFLCASMGSSWYRRFLASGVAGGNGAIGNLDSKALGETTIAVPNDAEIDKLGNFFTRLDSLITLHQRKCEYRSLCGYLSWEQRKLGELLLFQNGFNGSSESFGSGIPLISVMDVLDDKFITHETVRGKARLNCEEASRYCVEYGDVLFQRSSENQEDAGTSNVYLDQHVSSAFGGFVIRGKKVGEYNPIFIKYLLGSPFIREQITHRAQGAQHINVSQDTLADVVLLMPSMREQEAVGLVFLHLDNLITLHQ